MGCRCLSILRRQANSFMLGKMWSTMPRLLRPQISSIWQTIRNTSGNAAKSLEYIGKGIIAMKEVDRVMDYTDPDDERLQPLLKTAKENFEMALEVDNRSTQAMLLLGRLHLDYYIPTASADIGAALLTESAEMGNTDAQYELACQLRKEEGILDVEGKSLYWLESAACQLHPKALFLVGCIYLGGEHTTRDVKAAAWCFGRAAEKGHSGAATVYGALIAKGFCNRSITDATTFVQYQKPVNGEGSATVEVEESTEEVAREYFQMAAEGGDELALEWLNRLPANEMLSDPKSLP